MNRNQRTKGVRHAGGASKPPSPGAAALAAILDKRGARAALARKLAKAGYRCSQSHLSDICRGHKHASGTLAFAIEEATGIPARLLVAPKAA